MYVFYKILRYSEGKIIEFKVAQLLHGIISSSQKTTASKEQSLEEASLG